jgi:DNA-binding PadR family transcriptional regulator
MTNAELAVLSLIVEQPRHGYDIEAQIEARGMREWTEIGFSSIYAILKKLAQRGWVDADAERSVGQGAPRKVYQITKAGREAQRAAVIEALEAPARASSSLLIGLANIPIVGGQRALPALAIYRAALEARLERLLSRAEAQSPLPDFVQAMFDYSETMIRAELGWLRKYTLQLGIQHG